MSLRKTVAVSTTYQFTEMETGSPEHLELRLNKGAKILNVEKYRRSLEKRIASPDYPDRYAAKVWREKLEEINRLQQEILKK